jgi:DNA-binding NtrC family response regulator
MRARVERQLERPAIIGRSVAIEALLAQVERVAPTEATVLIVGERGTGKELVATALQRASRRRDHPFVAVNCAALTTELLASELFGHERGAFTGAAERAIGLVRAADGGTLFLDEVGDLPLPAQAMLLRFLQEREVRAVGGRTTARVDVRVIAATNADLDRAIRERTFRADLHDRLAEVVLEVPPLRERREDIPVLVEHFLAVHSHRHGVRTRGLTPEAREVIDRHPWPGNVRQLEHALSRAVIFAGGGWIRPADLGLREVDAERPATPEDPDARSSCPERLSSRQRDIARHARQGEVLHRRDLVARYGVSGETARRDLLALVRLGILRRDGRRRGCRYAPVSGAPADGGNAQ